MHIRIRVVMKIYTGSTHVQEGLDIVTTGFASMGLKNERPKNRIVEHDRKAKSFSQKNDDHSWTRPLLTL